MLNNNSEYEISYEKLQLNIIAMPSLKEARTSIARPNPIVASIAPIAANLTRIFQRSGSTFASGTFHFLLFF
jgi:hypothetical protein